MDLERYFDDAGLDRDDALGLRLWQNKDHEYYAILPKESPMAELMLELLEWDKGRKLIIDASFPAGSELNNRVQIDAFKQTGWVVP